MADAEFPNKVLEGRCDEISPCVGCMTSETDMKIEAADTSKTVVIVGGGVGGLEAAWVSAARGHNVILLEKRDKPGGQAYTASTPPHKQGFARVIKHYLTMCKKHGVDIRLNTEATADMIASLHPDVVILSTGATPVGLDVPNDGIAVAQVADVLGGEVISGYNVLVVGGGLVGLETADFLLSQKRLVTVVEMLDKAGAGRDYVLYNTLRNIGDNIMTSTKVQRFTKDGAVCLAPQGEITLSGYDMVILAVGSRPYNPLEKELEGKVRKSM